MRNQALIAKQGWRFMVQKDILWRKVTATMYHWNEHVVALHECFSHVKGPQIMKNIQSSAGWYKIKLGKGNKTSFWKYKWLICVPLFEAFPRLYKVAVSKVSCVNHLQISKVSSKIHLPIISTEILIYFVFLYPFHWVHY